MRGGELAEGATEERVKALIRNVQRGGGQNGVGHGQLITISLVKEAERLGEAHIPWFQMRVAFRYLNDLIAAYGWRGGASAYNAGPGNRFLVWNTYGSDMVRLEREWQPRLAGADDEPKEPDDPRWKENWEEARAYGREPERRGVLPWFWDEAPSTGP